MFNPDTPKIYVACLAAYNGGRLHGSWIDADQDVDDIWSAVQKMLKSSPEPDAEEWAIHSYDGFGGMRLSESESFERVSELGQALVEHGPAFSAYCSVADDPTVENFEDASWGEFDSGKDFAQSWYDEMGADLGSLRGYIDWERVWRGEFDCAGFTGVRHGGSYFVFHTIH